MGTSRESLEEEDAVRIQSRAQGWAACGREKGEDGIRTPSGALPRSGCVWGVQLADQERALASGDGSTELNQGFCVSGGFC